MGKKKLRKSRESRGLQGSPSKCKTSKGMQRLLNQQAAWLKGKRVKLPVYTIVKRENAPDEIHAYNTVEAKSIWGSPNREAAK